MLAVHLVVVGDAVGAGSGRRLRVLRLSRVSSQPERVLAGR